MHPTSMALSAYDIIEIAAEDIHPRATIQVRIVRESGVTELFEATAAIETMLEVEILHAGGVIPLILEKASPALQ
jgi:aconitate hydratase